MFSEACVSHSVDRGVCLRWGFTSEGGRFTSEGEGLPLKGRFAYERGGLPLKGRFTSEGRGLPLKGEVPLRKGRSASEGGCASEVGVCLWSWRSTSEAESTQPPSPVLTSSDDHCNGRRASYWNAFLFYL